MARESGRPIIWNGCSPTGRSTSTAAPGTPIAMRSSNSHSSTRRKACACSCRPSRRTHLEFTFEDDNLLDTIPVWKEALLGTVEEKRAKLADPERRQGMKDVHEERGGLFGAGYVLDEIRVNWISSDAPNAQEIKERYEGFTIGEIAAREGKHSVDAMLDIAVAGDLKVGFATRLLETRPSR